MFIKKTTVQYLPVLLVFFLVISSFIDYNFNYIWSLFSKGNIIQGLIYVLIYHVFLVFFLYSYIMVTFSDPGYATKDVVNVLTANELESFYTTLEEIPEYKKMIESTSTNSSQPSTGALLKDEERINNKNNYSTSTLTIDNQDKNGINSQYDIPLKPIPSSSQIDTPVATSNVTLIEALNESSSYPKQERESNTIIQIDYLSNDNNNIRNVVFNRNNSKKDQISIDIDNDNILERNLEKLNNNESINERDDHESRNEEVNNTVCKKCFGFKPERCHHCSVCNRCILKMDHHCPWISNCVGLKNYKYFVLFLFYGSIYILFQCITIAFSLVLNVKISNQISDIILFLPDYQKLWVIHIFISFVLGVTITLMFITHVTQTLLKNSTTLELFDEQRKIRDYRFKLKRERGKKEIEKLENEIEELENQIVISPNSPDTPEKRKELKLKQSKLEKKVKDFNSIKNRSPRFESSSPRNIPKRILHNPYNLGALNNFYQVFGKNPKLWFIPVYSSEGDGYHYPKIEYHD
ncbi:zf-DHHC-domain-containing protein [Anaeromyces robustus]|uniref:Palmitoyltransferase n=1 Tax=Anaeromyces robustus TaxID=1754192 RepID=A0A1Y1WV97_9FUNG|nr:zf-DHHC-domain-containing protein [Anaeromyces robustus]|eukprot:ORX77228.1 zf-DHHC-domain-containing protein [Anaeromyces robustus]